MKMKIEEQNVTAEMLTDVLAFALKQERQELEAMILQSGKAKLSDISKTAAFNRLESKIVKLDNFVLGLLYGEPTTKTILNANPIVKAMGVKGE